MILSFPDRLVPSLNVTTVSTFLLVLALQTTQAAAGPEELWDIWQQERFVQTPAPCIRPPDLQTELQRLAELHPGTITLEEIGRSVQDRPINMITLGRGDRTVLLWSQMHGDEPSATPALLDIVQYLLSRADQPEAAAILDGLTLLMIPMLNPDGAEIYQRRNQQAIDINRDALHLSTPEGRILKGIRDEHQPMLGFNLHDQGRRIAVGDTGVLATISVLAVAGDAEGTLTPGRQRARRACSAIAQSLTRFIPGGVARYGEDWNSRAFGDNITAWGTPVVLIESGGVPPGHPLEELTRLNFVAILTVLQELVRNDLADHDPAIYENLHRNRRNAWADVVVRGGHLRQPGNGPAYRADLAFMVEVDDRDLAGCSTGRAPRSYIAEIGDASLLGAGREVEAANSLVVSPFAAGIEGWKARKWLSAEMLAEVARLGVGTVNWNVPSRKTEAAKTLARGLAGEGRAELRVVTSGSDMPWLRLTGPPATPRSQSLEDTVTALTDQPPGGGAEILDRLCRLPGGPPQPALSRGRPASFVLLSPAVDGEVDPATARLVSVYINGFDVKGDSR